jgi:hypothetical protein
MKKYLIFVLALLIISCDDEQLIDSLKFPPEVQITNPNDLQTVSDSLTINAVATSNIGIAYCELWIDGSLVVNSEDFSEPYSFTIDTKNYSNGHHSLTVRATDTEGNSSDSDIIDIIFENGVVDEPDDDAEFSFYTIDSETDQLLKVDSYGNVKAIGSLDYNVSTFSRLVFHNERLFMSDQTNSNHILYEINLQTGTADYIAHLRKDEGGLGVFGLTSIGNFIYILYEISSYPEGNLERINMNTLEVEVINYSNGNNSLLAMTDIDDEIYVYSESTDGMYQYDEIHGVKINTFSNQGLGYVWSMDALDKKNILALNRNSKKSHSVYKLNIENNNNQNLFEIKRQISGIAVIK